MLTRQEIAKIRTSYQEIGNIRKVAEQWGLSYNTIKKHVRKLPKLRTPYAGKRVDSRERIQVGEYWRYCHQLDTWKVLQIEGEQVTVTSGGIQKVVLLQEGKRPKEWALDWRHMEKS